MIKRFNIVLFLALAFIFASCNENENEADLAPVVEVDGKVLTIKQLRNAIPANLSPTDSASFSQNYISRWVKQTLLLRKAELNLNSSEKDVAQLLEDYRASLLVHKYQQQLLQQKYAPQITDEEINKYYVDMSDNFVLQHNIIQGMYIKLPISSPNLKQVKSLYKSDKEEDAKKLEEYCYQYANKFQDFSDKWTESAQLSLLVPNSIPSDSRFFKNNELFETQDSLYVYYVFIKDFKLKDEVAPLDYVQDKVKAILLNKKRIQFIQNLEEELYVEGLKQKAIKYY